jgi:GntR family transcriptional regulator
MADETAPSFVPLYRQVKRILTGRIASGEWRPGQPLPAEPRLGQELGVSPGTVRKALDELAHERLVVRRQGRGTFVAEQTPDTALFHFFRLVDGGGRPVAPTSRELSRGAGLATPGERRRLGLGPRARVLRLLRLREAGPARLIERIVVPLDLFPGIEDHPGELPNTLYDLYQRQYGRTVRRARELLTAVALAPEDARHLDVAPGAPALAIDRIAYTFEDRPLEWRRSLVDTTRAAYLADLA